MQRITLTRFISSSFLASCLSISVVFAADTFDKLDEYLLKGELDAARQQIELMYHTASIVTSKAVVTLKSYEKILNTLQAAKKFQDAVSKYETSGKTASDYGAVSASFSHFHHSWNVMPKQLPISRELLEHINSTAHASDERIRAIEAQYQELEAQRKQAAEAEQEKIRRAKEEAEKKRLADEEAERKKSEAEAQSRANAYNAKLNAINAAAVKAGYKGLNKKYGVARFLYHASQDGSLESGLNEVFWVRLSDRDQELDQEWSLSQVVGGWEIYEIKHWTGTELVRLSIGVKSAGGMPIEGQRLKGEYYVFRGNMQFRTVTGAMRIVQKFEPAALDIGAKGGRNDKKLK